MMQLNRINLPVSNVPELTRFFEAGFGFRVIEQRGMGKLAVMLGQDDFLLVLMHDKKVTADTYPAIFHVGFLFASQQEVEDRHARLVTAGFDAPEPAILERGGPKTYGFYCPAPGGVMVEVSVRVA